MVAAMKNVLMFGLAAGAAVGLLFYATKSGAGTSSRGDCPKGDIPLGPVPPPSAKEMESCVYYAHKFRTLIQIPMGNSVEEAKANFRKHPPDGEVWTLIQECGGIKGRQLLKLEKSGNVNEPILRDWYCKAS